VKRDAVRASANYRCSPARAEIEFRGADGGFRSSQLEVEVEIMLLRGAE
jgi:hypothetical protein